jgi:hypothetical protein
MTCLEMMVSGTLASADIVLSGGLLAFIALFLARATGGSDA